MNGKTNIEISIPSLNVVKCTCGSKGIVWETWYHDPFIFQVQCERYLNGCTKASKRYTSLSEAVLDWSQVELPFSIENVPTVN